MNTQVKKSIYLKAELFKILHQQPGIFVAPNPWDAGSAKVLESLGFKALATTSAGLAYALGKPDGYASVTRSQTLQNIHDIINSTKLPVAADLENGFGDDPETCAETILLAAETGVAGASIEDATGNPKNPIYPFELALERIKAAVSAAKKLSRPFTLTARVENLIHGQPNFGDTLKRLEAFAEAGADVLFAPGLKTKEEIEAVVKAVAPRPVNVLMGFTGANFSLNQLEDMGVKRISLGSSLVRAAYGALFKAATEVRETGTFSYSGETKPYAEINQLFKDINT